MKKKKCKSFMIYMILSAGFMLAGIDVLAAEEGVMRGMTAAHNKVRSEEGVHHLVWSDELAGFAQQWAEYLARENKCVMKHRPRQEQVAHGYGENLYWVSSLRWSDGKREVQQITPEKVVATWAQEAQYYESSSGTCRTGKDCGHYTQVVWNQTRKVGCGRAICSDRSQVWVCNYDPPGNYIGQKPY